MAPLADQYFYLSQMYGCFKLSDLSSTQCDEIIACVDDVDKAVLTDQFWEDEDIALGMVFENNQDEHFIESFVDKYDYHSTYTMLQLSHLMKNIKNNNFNHLKFLNFKLLNNTNIQLDSDMKVETFIDIVYNQPIFNKLYCGI